MAIIPKINTIQLHMEDGVVVNEHRPYMGCSSLGNKCKRKVWLTFYWAYEATIPKNVMRIFRRGDIEEELVVKDLTAAGIKVSNQQLVVTDDTGHIKGHIDGMVDNLPIKNKRTHLLEVKTMNSKRYADYIKNGLYKSSISYWVQMQMYMGYTGLDRCLYVVTNKDNEERSFERYHFDKDCFYTYKAVAFDILTSEAPPDKIGNHTWFECKMCDAYNYCHKDMPTSINCRTCAFVNLENNGVWSCDKHKTELTVDQQRIGCASYEKSEHLK